MTQTPSIKNAKEALRRSLTEHAGDTTHHSVVAAIEALSILNPTPAPARNFQLQTGHWHLISAPNFPDGTLQTNGRYVYPLGRLSFNMFQPQNLPVALDRVSQSIKPVDASQHTHDIQVEFTINDDAAPIRGIVQNLGLCQPYSDDTLHVEFTGGTLAPLPDTDLSAWTKLFGDPTSATAQRSLKAKLGGLFLKLMFGLVPPDGMNPDTGELAFTMTRSPKGKLRILYLDEDMRITTGEKESFLVCDR